MNLKLPSLASLALVLFASLTAPAAELPGFRVAQFDADDTYDPFADFSEFDEAQDEEADINFFRNGRFVTLGVIAGLRGFTGELGSLYQPATSFGAFLSYFFDLRFAGQFTFNTSSHGFSIPSTTSTLVARGTVGITVYSLDFKYYINTQNVTKGLAKFNPYVIAGVAQVERTTQLQNVQGFGKENAMGYNLGAGIELPLLHNKAFFGVQAEYNIVNFANEGTEVVFSNGQGTGIYPSGDAYTLFGILGINF